MEVGLGRYCDQYHELITHTHRNHKLTMDYMKAAKMSSAEKLGYAYSTIFILGRYTVVYMV